MRKIYATFITLLTVLQVSAQGWPADYKGVMLQGFAWDSYSESQWPQLESQADEIADYFDLIWVPNSAYAG
ncbi:MAG: alpha-amylase, partial [Prevotellaceae bacterium]|nr:alpha-amylase [Prevotellaceae bacterium]